MLTGRLKAVADAAYGLDRRGDRVGPAQPPAHGVGQQLQIATTDLSSQQLNRAKELQFQPEIIFVAGDLSDPHGTHRMCKEAIDGAVLELLKPVTWFPPMWAFACGVVSSGASSRRAGAEVAYRAASAMPRGRWPRPHKQTGAMPVFSRATATDTRRCA